jgi:hypothetical protein
VFQNLVCALMGREYTTRIDYYPCPCCGYRVHGGQGSTASCPICAWEDSEEQLLNPYLECAPNGISLWDAQHNFLKSGVSNPERSGHENIPKASDHRDESWRPIVKRLDDFGSPSMRTKIKNYDEMCYWRDTFWNCKGVYTSTASPQPVDLERAHGLSIFNRQQVLDSDLCGCFFCLAEFKPTEISEWIDRDLTPRCPRCGIDSVIGSASGFPIGREFLKAMKKRWF